jgi:hypothetical protein
MGQVASGLDGQVLELPFKNPEIPYPIGARLQVETGGLQPNYFDCTSTHYRRMHDADDHGDGSDRGSGILHLPSGIGAWSCLPFVCFRASWPVNCCTCSRQQIVESPGGISPPGAPR